MILRDLRHALRSLARSPGFTIAAVLTLGLGIGANTAIFSVVYGVLLKPLPYRDGDRLVMLRQRAESLGGQNIPFSVKEVSEIRQMARGFDGLVEHHSMFFVLLGRDEPERVSTGVVSANFFDVLGVTPLLGRSFVAADEQLDAEPVLLLSHGYWQRSFGGAQDVVGRVFEMNDRAHTVIGVLPPIPQFPATHDVYMPTSACPFRAAAEQRMEQDRSAFRALTAFARIPPGAAVEGAAAEMTAIAQRFRDEYPETYRPEMGYAATALSLQEELTRNARPTLLVLMATAGAVLLIACANVANLGLARMVGRGRELAVRAALGASRARLIRQLLTESCVLSLLGGIVGIAIAYLAMDMLVGFAARFTPRAVNVQMDGWVLAFTVGLSLLTGLLFGAAPAAGRADLAPALREGARGSGGGSLSLRRGLIIAEVAVAFVLLISAGLLLRSLQRLQQVDPGFRSEDVVTAEVSVNWSNYDDPEQVRAYFSAVLERLEGNPFVREAAVAGKVPFTSQNPFTDPVLIESQPVEPGMEPEIDFNSVTDGYFEALGIPLVAGRTFDASDDPAGARVAIINTSLARRYWAGTDPLGDRVSIDDGETWMTIVGVVGDTRLYGLDRQATDELYASLRQEGFGRFIVLRTSGDAPDIGRQIKDIAYAIDAQSPIDNVRTLATMQSDAAASPRLTAVLLAVFAGVALAITITGIGGLIAFSVSQRTREIGIRMALGARPGSVLTLVLRQGLELVAAGVAIGLIGSLAFTRFFRAMLFEVTPGDPITFALVIVAVVITTVVATVLPARRAARIDPVEALRSE